MAVLAKGHTHHELYRASQTYTSSLAGFANAVEIGLNCSGNRFGVGLSAAAVPCNVNGSFYKERFDTMDRLGAELGRAPTQLSIWGM